jgi:5-methylcytosine-specific restriction endonuclease McrA
LGASELDHRYKKLRKWARDNLDPICCFCGRYIDRSLKWPDKWSWTANHIVPLNRGGDPYAKDNILPAHLTCNSSAQDKVPRTKIDW